MTGVVGVSPALWYFRYIASIFLTLHKRLCANYAEILVSLAIKSHFTGSVRWYEAQESEVLSIIRHRGAPRRSLGNYKKTAIFEVPLYALLLIELPTPVYEDRISFPNQCGFSQFILRRKKGNKPSNITYGCRIIWIYLSWKIYSTSFIKFIGWWNIFHKFLLTCICRLTRWRQLVDLPPSAKWWCNTHNLSGIPRSHVHVPIHVRLLNLSIVHVATCEFSICYKIILWFFTRFKCLQIMGKSYSNLLS